MNFLNSASSASALVFYLPSGGSSVKSGVHWHKGKTEKGQSPEYFLKSSKKTQTPCTLIPVEKSECWYLAYVVVWENKSEISNAYLVQLLFIMSFIGMSRTCAFITFIRPCRIQFTICVNRHFKERSLYTFPNNNSN